MKHMTRSFISWLYQEPTHIEQEHRVWHKAPALAPPVRLTDGGISGACGTLWRRHDGQCWIYRQDEETEAEYQNRQW